MRQLVPSPAAASEVDLDAFYAFPTPAGRAWVRANFVTSLDGAISAQGRSEGLSGPTDIRIFGLLRALADVVLVGAGTARVEGYGPVSVRSSYAGRRAAAGQSPAAVLAVVSGRLDLDPQGPLFVGGTAGRVLVITCARAPADRRAALTARRADVVVAGEDRVDVTAALEALTARGLSRILCEGGPQLITELVGADRLDELCLTVSPQLQGGGAPRMLSGPELIPPARLQLAGLLEEDGFLFCRYLARSQ